VGIIRILSILLIFVCSYLSWKYIEQTFRYKVIFDFKKTIYYILTPILITVFIIYGIIDHNDGFPERFPEISQFESKDNHPNVVRKECFDKYKIGNCDECYLGIKKDKLDGVLIGDSFANHSAAFIDVLAKDADLYIHDSTAGGFPLLNNLNPDGSPTKNNTEYARQRLEYAKQFNVIYIAANWEEQSTPDSKNYQSIVNEIGKLVQLGKKIVLIDGLRMCTEETLHKARLFKAQKFVLFKEKKFSALYYDRPSEYMIYVIKNKFPSVKVIDLNDVMCKDKTCDIELENTIVYRNFNHLNTSGARLIGEKYLKLWGNPLKEIVH
jgi:hypothetical protein